MPIRDILSQQLAGAHISYFTGFNVFFFKGEISQTKWMAKLRKRPGLIRACCRQAGGFMPGFLVLVVGWIMEIIPCQADSRCSVVWIWQYGHTKSSCHVDYRRSDIHNFSIAKPNKHLKVVLRHPKWSVYQILDSTSHTGIIMEIAIDAP